MQYLFFSDYFTLYDSFQVHPCLCKWHNFISFYGWIRFHCIYVAHLLYPFLCWWTDYFHVLAIINSAAMSTGLHVSSWVRVFSGYMPSSRIAGSYGSSPSHLFYYGVFNSDEIYSRKLRPWIILLENKDHLLTFFGKIMSSREPTSLENFNSPQMSIHLKDFASTLSNSAGHILLRINLIILDCKFQLTNYWILHKSLASVY